MEPLKISVSVEVNLSKETKDFILSVINSTALPTAAPAKSAPAPAPAQVSTPAPAKPASAPAQVSTPAPAPAPAINIETVRQALAAKVNGHREEIKAKLNELGSPSVTKLDPAKYGEMLSFLNSLA